MVHHRHTLTDSASSAQRVAFYRNPWVRSAVAQLALLVVLLWLGYEFVRNARLNIEAQHIGQGFGFLENTAGFGVNQSLIAYNESDTYGRVFLVGLLNTLLVAGLGAVLATILGFVIGIARLSPNWLLARLAGGYVELVRNLPLLFQILFWYLAVLGTLPGPRQSISLFGEIYLNNRGAIVPAPLFGPGASYAGYALLVAVFCSLGLRHWVKVRQAQTGRPFPVAIVTSLLIVGLPLIALAAAGWPLRFERPELRGFNFVGGVRLIPEFIALLLGLTIYTAAFIAEIVRAGILAVPRGQTEAASALGLSRRRTLRLVIVPQALRVIVPPLTNQYLNLTKNSSLAVAIGYPDLFAVFAGTALSQTGQAIEIIAITMAVYLSISLLTSAFMNWYNARIALVQR
ncbi:MAG: amino acid ABC transporter permease [Xanthobacteraceae bacterium]|jgi:general L-amino acid transport system permease protein